MAAITGKLSQVLLSTPSGGFSAEPGSVQLTLCGYGSTNPRSSKGTSLGRVDKEVKVNPADGTFNIGVIGNDVIEPPNTYYTYIVKDSNGDIIQCEAFQFADAQNYDMDFAQPFDPSLPIPPVPPLIFNQLQVIDGGLNPVCLADQFLSFKITLNQDATISVTNPAQGMLYTFIIKQDATGGRKLTWPGNCLNASDVMLNPNGVTVQTFVVDDANNLYSISTATWWV